MKKIHIVNTAVFTSVAALHAMRLAFQAPATIGAFEVELWISAVALVGTAALALLNWQAVGKHSKSDLLWFFFVLVLLDAAIGLYSWIAEISYWGISGDSFLWFVLIDLVIAGIIHGAVRKRTK
ncbi:hypothetical protein HON52_02110 [Candidatus Uhrbacteria bacterium]|jgi:hypothetical protein|nr:hypothetical protein [Candidatus Uhrbacteria bacterium]